MQIIQNRLLLRYLTFQIPLLEHLHYQIPMEPYPYWRLLTSLRLTKTINGSLDISNAGIPGNRESFTIRHGGGNTNSTIFEGGYFAQRDGNAPFSALSGLDDPSNVPVSPVRILGVGGAQLNVNDTNSIRFFTDPTYGGSMNEGILRMIINPDGNIGIGTITALPNDALE